MQVSISNVLLLKNSLRTLRAQAPAAAPRQGSTSSVWRSIRRSNGDESREEKNETILLSLSFWDVYCSQFYNLNQGQNKIPATRSIFFSLWRIRKTRCSSSKRSAWLCQRCSSLLMFGFHVISATFFTSVFRWNPISKNSYHSISAILDTLT